MASQMSIGLLLVISASAMLPAYSHGRMTTPVARSGEDNMAVAGGPGNVFGFGSDGKQTKYQHGICGNVAGTDQIYNMAGDIAATYTAGSTIEINVTIAAHHVGYFEFDLCDNAGELTEACFSQHHLLRDGCTCNCPGDASNSCSACNACRWFWKAPMQGELVQSVTAGYAGPVLPGAGNLVPYDFTMYYVLPAGVTTPRGVLRWHYVTTNSCTSKSSAPEEFWNCADVAVADASGNTGSAVEFDNDVLRNLEVENLMPAIIAGTLSGLSHACPVDSEGKLKGVGGPEEYHCGAENADGTFEFCKGASPSGSAGTDVQCDGVSEDAVQCLEDCGDWWYQCANGAAFVKPVPVGAKCKIDEFVIAAVCTSATTAIASTTASVTSRRDGTCSGSPCGDVTHCRSEWGFCGSGIQYCNVKSTWTAVGCGVKASTSTVPTPSTTLVQTSSLSSPEIQSTTRVQALATTTMTASEDEDCRGDPCPDPSMCRSKWGWCGSSSAYCNMESTWRIDGCNAISFAALSLNVTGANSTAKQLDSMSFASRTSGSIDCILIIAFVAALACCSLVK